MGENEIMKTIDKFFKAVFERDEMSKQILFTRLINAMGRDEALNLIELEIQNRRNK